MDGHVSQLMQLRRHGLRLIEHTHELTSRRGWVAVHQMSTGLHFIMTAFPLTGQHCEAPASHV